MSPTAQPDSRVHREVLEKFLLGFEGTSLPQELRGMLAEGLAGVVIYRRNWESIDGLRALTAEIRAAAGRPVLVAMDAEPAGKFSLPVPFTQWPAAEELGRLEDPTLVERMAQAIGTELRAVGANLNFAPMLDLHVHPESPVTSGRSFGGDPQRVARMGAAFHRGLAAVDLLSCAKHFPGHGDTVTDPHEDLPVFQGDQARLESVDLVPFAAAIAAGVPMVMTAHILMPKIDVVQPASLSRKLLFAVLRQKLHFDGVILADDLGMGAIRKRHGAGQAAFEAIRAGTDIVALCHDWSQVPPSIETVTKAIAVGMLDVSDREASRHRVERLRARTEADAPPAPGPEVLGCAEHLALAEDIRNKLK